ncbi:MAG: carbon-nitrogen hydrolase family protein, partial [Planctomycetes bacterium]|nr:carbon-nitrogen hydrolase family protein [Planctomycetota bacterium]
GQGTPQENLDLAIEHIDAAGRDHADILCLPELFSSFGKPSEKGYQRAQEVPGPITKPISRKARRHKMYVICPLLQKHDGVMFNTAVLIDRGGRIAGMYHKHVPTIGELEKGISPGTEIPAFETDFGRIGIAICFDINFPDIAEQFYRQQVKFIFWPSMFEGGILLDHWARQCDAYVVSSTWGDSARIIDVTGKTLSTASWPSPLVTAEVNTQRGLYHYDYHAEKIARMKKKYGPAVSVEWMKSEAWAVVTCNRSGLNLRDLEREFKLERMRDYLARARAVRDKAALKNSK